MMKNEITVFAPATVSNVGCGFDILGFAIDKPGDEITVIKTDDKKVSIKEITGDDGKIPYEIEKNTAGFAVQKMYEELVPPFGVEIEIHKKMGLGSGLGSSAASAVGAVYAFNQLLEKPLTKNELLKFAIEGEKIASKSIHADNVAPCLFGGITLIRGYNPIDLINIPVPGDLYCAVIYADIQIKTSEARKILPEKVNLKDAVKYSGNTAGIIAGFYEKDLNLLSRSLEDNIVEPHRAKLIPFYSELKEIALKENALNLNISGSGPALFSFCDSKEIAETAVEKMQDHLKKINIKSEIYVSKINKIGPKIIND